MITETIKKLNKELDDAEKEGITNESGRKAYIRKECEDLQKKVDHTGLQLEINKTMQKSLKRRLNFCMTLLKEDIL